MSDFAERITLDMDGTAVDGTAARGLQATGEGTKGLLDQLKQLAGFQGAETSVAGLSSEVGGLGSALGFVEAGALKVGAAVAGLAVAAGAALGAIAAATAKAADEDERLVMQLASGYTATENWTSAMEHAVGVAPQLQDIVTRTGEKVDTLAKTFRTLTQLTSASDAQIVKVTESLSVMARTATMSTDALMSTIARAAKTGQLPLRGEAGREVLLGMGLTGEELKWAADSGQLMELLERKLANVNERAVELSLTWGVLGAAYAQTASDIESGIGKAWEPLTVVLRLLHDDARPGLLELAGTIGDVGKAIVGAKVAEWRGAWLWVKDAVKSSVVEFGGLLGMLQLLGVIKEKALGDNTGEKFRDRPGADATLPGADLKKIEKAQEAYDKFFQTLDREHDLAGLTGVDKALRQIENHRKDGLEKVARDSSTFLKDAESQARAIGLVNDTAARQRDAALDAEAQKEAQRQAKAEQDAEKWSAGLEAQDKKQKATRAQLDVELAHLEKGLSEDRIDQMQDQAKAEIAAMGKVAEEARKHAKELEDLALANPIASRTQVENEYNATIERIREDLAARTLAIQVREAQQEKTLLDQRRGDWDAYYDDLVRTAERTGDRSYATMHQFLQKVAQEAYDNAQTVAQGFDAAWRQILASTKTYGQEVADFLVSTAHTIGDGFGAALNDVLAGDFGNLRNTLRSVGDGIRRDFSKMVQGMVQDWITGQQKMVAEERAARAAGYGTSGGYYQQTGPNEATYVEGGQGQWGAAIGGGMQGAGVGSMVGGMSGAPGFSTGAVIGGVVGGVVTALIPSIGAEIGALVGTTAASGNYIAAIIVAVIGGLIAVLNAPNTESHYSVTGTNSRILSGGGINDISSADLMQRQVDQTLFEVRSGVVGYAAGLFEAAKSPDAHRLTELLNQRILDFYKNMNFEAHAGSSEDLQKDINRILTDQMPKELWHSLFGQAQSAGINMPGVSGAHAYTPWIQDQSAPMVQFMKGLGFSVEEIERIAGRIDTMEVDKFQAWLQRLVGVVVTFNNLAEEGTKTTGQHFDDIRALMNQAADKPFLDAAEHIRQLGEDLQYLTGDEQLKKAEELQQAMGSMFQGAQQALANILATIDAIKQQSEGIHQRALAAISTPGQNEGDLRARIFQGFFDLSAAPNQAQVAKVFQELQQDLSSLLDTIVQRIGRIRSLQSELASFQLEVANRNAPQFGSDPGAWLLQNANAIREVETALSSAVGDDAIAKTQQLIALNRERYQNEIQLLQQVRDTVKSIHDSVAAQLFDLGLQQMDPHAQGDAMYARIQELQASLQGAHTPQEVQQIVSEIQGLVSRLAGQEQDPAHYNESRDILAGILRDTVLGGMEDFIQSDLDKLGASLQKGEEALTKELEAAQRDFTNTLGLLDKATDMATQRLLGFADAITTVLQELTAAVKIWTAYFTGGGDGSGGGGVVTPGGGVGTGGGVDGGGGPGSGHGPGRRAGGEAASGSTAAPGSTATINLTLSGQTPEQAAAAIVAQLEPSLIAMLRANNQRVVQAIRDNPNLISR